MPRDIPGFYFDQVKNRYFPTKGRIPGSSVNCAPPRKPVEELDQVRSTVRKGVRTWNLLQGRELNGGIVSIKKRKICFQHECEKNLVSQPMVWRYHGTEEDCNGALGVMRVNVDTHVGQFETDVLLTGGVNGSLSIFETGIVQEESDEGLTRIAEHVWPDPLEKQPSYYNSGKDILKLIGGALFLPSRISCVCMPRKSSIPAENVASVSQHAIITTLGSASTRGSIYSLNLTDSLDLHSDLPVIERLHEVSPLGSSIWAADCNSNGSKVVIGTNLGASLVSVDTGVATVICRSKSDVLSLQLLQSENTTLCGFRNGMIVTMDIRQRSREFTRFRLPYPSHESIASSRTVPKGSKRSFEIRGNISPKSTIHMPSSISCLSSLQLYDQYFLASSMNGSIWLYDHRLIERGPVQSYEGHVNSHTRIQLRVDPLERFVMSGANFRMCYFEIYHFVGLITIISILVYTLTSLLGGEDCYMRVWSIKSGEMLFEEKLLNSIPATVCCQQRMAYGSGAPAFCAGSESYRRCAPKEDFSWGAWLGSDEGLFWMQFF